MKKTKAAAFIACICLLLLTACAATHPISKSEVGALAEDTLSPRYGASFDVTDIAPMDEGVNFSQPYWLMHAERTGTDETYLLRAQPDGTEIKDCYGKILYGEEVEEILEEILGQYPDVTVNKVETQ